VDNANKTTGQPLIGRLAIKAGMSFLRMAEKPQGYIVGGEVPRSGSADH